MIRDEELIRRRRAKALGAIPRHILDHEQGAVSEEDIVEQAVADDDVIRAFDDGGEDAEAGGGGGVGVVDEDGGVGAFHPVCVRGGVDGCLHVAAVEVDACACGHVVEAAGEAEHVPEEGAGCCDLVDVEAGVYQ